VNTQLIEWINKSVTGQGQFTGFSAVHFAAAQGFYGLFLLLANIGADLVAATQNGVNCFHFAAKADDVRILHYMVSKRVLTDVDMMDYAGCSALHWACLDGSYDAVKYLLALGADPNL
jgi:ankyrin repeat protein